MATDSHHSHGDDGTGPLNHETTDISLDGIGKLTVGFVLVILTISGLMYGTYRLLDRRANSAAAPVSKINADRVATEGAIAPLMDHTNAVDRNGRQAAGPRILTNEPAWLREVRAATTAAQTTYGWVDKQAGVVRLPIERAKQLIVERGLPATAAPAAPEAPAEPAATPAAAAPAAATPPAAH